LFDPPGGVRQPLVLKPGVAYCLRRFHEQGAKLIQAIGTHARTLELMELEKRIELLEQRRASR
jgi:hypothetical protein